MQVFYHKAPQGWTPNEPNPFADNGSYAGWSCFEIIDNLNNFRHGCLDNGLFLMKFDRILEKLEIRLADFLRYETKHNRQVIIAAPINMDIDSFVSNALETYPPGSFLTQEESRWLVHSTSLESWKEICRCGYLKSLANLRLLSKNVIGLGIEELKEPEDYAEYIMLGNFDGIGCEHVVASHSRREIFTEENTPYIPGVRLYFDGHQIIRDGLAEWDGIHILKIRNKLALEPYLMMAIGSNDIAPENQRNIWTPRTFLEAANEQFLRISESQ